MVIAELLSWLTLIVFVPPTTIITLAGSVVIVHGTTGDGDGDGDGDGEGVGLGVGVGVGVPPPRFGVGVGNGSPSLIGVGVGIGSTPSISGGVGVGVPLASGVGVGVAPEARSPTRKFTFGTESSNTLLSTVMSPEPVTSTDTESEPFFNVIETCALVLVISPTILNVRPRQSNAIVSTVSKLTSLGNWMVFVSNVPSLSRSIVTS